ncbi:hypothetical protein FOL47_003692, partial [Perkinsus chesapeaki]
VTDLVSSKLPVEESTRFFLFVAPNRRGGRLANFPADVVNRYLDGVVLAEFDGAESLTLDDFLHSYYCYYLVTASECGTANTRVSCTCKESRDWGLCMHGYCAEIAVGSQLRFAPGQHRMPTIRRGRRSTRRPGPLERTYSGVSAAPRARSSNSDLEELPEEGHQRSSDEAELSEATGSTVRLAGSEQTNSDWEGLSDLESDNRTESAEPPSGSTDWG